MSLLGTHFRSSAADFTKDQGPLRLLEMDLSVPKGLSDDVFEDFLRNPINLAGLDSKSFSALQTQYIKIQQTEKEIQDADENIFKLLTLIKETKIKYEAIKELLKDRGVALSTELGNIQLYAIDSAIFFVGTWVFIRTYDQYSTSQQHFSKVHTELTHKIEAEVQRMRTIDRLIETGTSRAKELSKEKAVIAEELKSQYAELQRLKKIRNNFLAIVPNKKEAILNLIKKLESQRMELQEEIEGFKRKAEVAAGREQTVQAMTEEHQQLLTRNQSQADLQRWKFGVRTGVVATSVFGVAFWKINAWIFPDIDQEKRPYFRAFKNLSDAVLVDLSVTTFSDLSFNVKFIAEQMTQQALLMAQNNLARASLYQSIFKKPFSDEFTKKNFQHLQTLKRPITDERYF